MNIIIEGCDGVGKTTLAKKLADKYCCDILHMTKKVIHIWYNFLVIHWLY